MKNTEQFESFAKEILDSEIFGQNKSYTQHGGISIYEHCHSVARLSFSMGELFRVKDKKSLVRSALLHDFFLYDWHVPEKMWSLHGWTHPAAAAENGKKYFDINEKEYSMIRTHMWPYTLFHIPLHGEGWIICIADKLVSAWETLFGRFFKKKKRAVSD